MWLFWHLGILVLAMGPGTQPVVRVWTTEMVWFRSKPVQKLERLLWGPDPYPWTHPVCRAGLDPSFPISSSVHWGFLFLVNVRYPTAHCNMLTLVHRCPLLMYWPPLHSKARETHSLTHHENDRKQCMDVFWSCIMSSLSGDWIQMFINEVNAAFKRKRECDKLPAPF